MISEVPNNYYNNYNNYNCLLDLRYIQSECQYDINNIGLGGSNSPI